MLWIRLLGNQHVTARHAIAKLSTINRASINGPIQELRLAAKVPRSLHTNKLAGDVKRFSFSLNALPSCTKRNAWTDGPS